jgi:hypothetical protein
MGTLKEVNARQKFTTQTIGKLEKILNVRNGHWNNRRKCYDFEFGEKFYIENIYLSEKAMLHIVAQHCTTNVKQKN